MTETEFAILERIERACGQQDVCLFDHVGQRVVSDLRHAGLLDADHWSITDAGMREMATFRAARAGHRLSTPKVQG